MISLHLAYCPRKGGKKSDRILEHWRKGRDSGTRMMTWNGLRTGTRVGREGIQEARPGQPSSEDELPAGGQAGGARGKEREPGGREDWRVDGQRGKQLSREHRHRHEATY